MKSGEYEPRPEHKFCFGLRTIDNRGRDPVGDAVRLPISSVDIVAILAAVGGWAMNFDKDTIRRKRLFYERRD